MNDLAQELEQKANTLLRECSDNDLVEAAIYMQNAAKCVKSFEVKKLKEKVLCNKQELLYTQKHNYLMEKFVSLLHLIF